MHLAHKNRENINIEIMFLFSQVPKRSNIAKIEDIGACKKLEYLNKKIPKVELQENSYEIIGNKY